MLTLWTILADTSDNGLLDLGPLATDVGGLVVVASAGGLGHWVWVHLEHFTVLLVGPVGAPLIFCKVKKTQKRQFR